MRLCSEEEIDAATLEASEVRALETADPAAGRRLHEAQAADRALREAHARRLCRYVAWLRRSDLAVQFLCAITATLLLVAAHWVTLTAHRGDTNRLPLLLILLGMSLGLPLFALAWAGLSTWLRDRIQVRIEEFGRIANSNSNSDIGRASPWICPGCWESHGAFVPAICPQCRMPRPGDAEFGLERRLRERRERMDAVVAFLSTIAGVMLAGSLLQLVGCALPRF